MVEEFSGAGVAVTGLRVFALPAEPAAATTAWRAAGIGRVVAPLALAGELAPAASAAGLRLSLVNTGETAAQLGAGLRDAALFGSARFTFNPAHAVAAGERPFLGVYHRTRMAGVLDQLDVVDSLWDAMPAPLGRGNAEIRELVSILRCRNFGGHVVLGGGGRYPYLLAEAGRMWLETLDNI